MVTNNSGNKEEAKETDEQVNDLFKQINKDLSAQIPDSQAIPTPTDSPKEKEIYNPLADDDFKYFNPGDTAEK